MSSPSSSRLTAVSVRGPHSSGGRAVQSHERGPDHPEGEQIYIYIYIYIERERYIYISDVWTSQSEQFLTLSLMKCH